MTARAPRGCAILILVLAAACEPETLDLDDVGQTQSAIFCEQPGLADIVGESANCPTEWCGYLADPGVTMKSYAVVDIGCTGTFIGPNILMSAAHCGFPSDGTNPTVHLYRGGAVTPVNVASFTSCGLLVQGINCVEDPPVEGCQTVPYTTAVDTALLYCEDVDIGSGRSIPPGLLFGYADFDTQTNFVGQDVYKLWVNPIFAAAPCSGTAPDGGVGVQHLLYSTGDILDIHQEYEGNPSSSIEVSLSTCIAPGASGSVSFDPSTHRIIGGPLKTGFGNEFGSCGSPSDSTQVRSMFEDWVTLDGPYHSHLNELNIGELLSITPPALVTLLYDGAQDRNPFDYVFDLQADIEAFQGEKARDAYWLGFESQRRNAQWNMNFPVSFEHLGGFANVTNAPGNDLTLPKIAIEPGRDLRGSIRIQRIGASTGGEIRVWLQDPANGATVSSATVPIPAGGGWNTRSFRLFTGPTVTPGQYRLTFEFVGNFTVFLSSLNLMVEGKLLDFDTYDMRRPWRRNAAGGVPLVLPEGRSAAAGRPGSVLGGFSFAGAVHDDGVSEPQHWTLRHESLGLRQGGSYRICFWARSYGAGATTLRGRVRSAGGTNFGETNWSVTSTWAEKCLPLVTPTTQDAVLEFGIDEGAGTALVDDIMVLPLDLADGNLLLAANVDGDGQIELYNAFNATDGNSAIYLSQTGSPNGARIYGPNPSWKITAIAVGDVDDDGQVEVYTAFNGHNGTAAIYRSTNPAALPGPRIFPSPADPPTFDWYVTALAVFDSDGDGRPELFSGLNSKAGSARIFHSTTGLMIGPSVYGPTPDDTLTALAAGDVDGNGTPELYAAIVRRTVTVIMRREGTTWSLFRGGQADVIPAMTFDVFLRRLYAAQLLPLGTRIHWWSGISQGDLLDVPAGRASSMTVGNLEPDLDRELDVGFTLQGSSEIWRSDANPWRTLWSSTYWRN